MKIDADKVQASLSRPMHKTKITCDDCTLAGRRVVHGDGKIEWAKSTRIMFIGEAPGRNEEKNGYPFCGAAGKHFNSILKQLGLTREKIWTTNTVKCRPDNNDKPDEAMVKCCRVILKGEIETLKPRLIVPLGRLALNNFLDGTMYAYHGKAFFKKTSYGHVIIFPLYHPAVLCYDENKYLPIYKEDVAKLKILLSLKEGYEL